jgi:hypothetical protein
MVASVEGAILGLGWVGWVCVRKLTSSVQTELWPRKARHNKCELFNVVGVKGEGDKSQVGK